ncbi:MAG: ABC transporter permease [Longimicrobiales bacterium]
MWKDVGYALRMLRRAPGFTAVVVATLALGIGGTTAVFSVVQAVLLAPLPYERPGQLVRLYLVDPENPSYRNKIYFASPQFREIRDHAASFQDIAAIMTYRETGVDLVTNGRAERLRALEVSSDYFRTLGSDLRRGREFDREDEVGTARVVLSDALWRTRFDADPSVIGTTVRLSDELAEVVGIAPPGFEDPIIGEVDVWVPYDLTGTGEQNFGFSVVARLRNDVNLEQARAEFAVLSQSLAEQWPSTDKNVIDAVALKDDVVARRPYVRVAGRYQRSGAGRCQCALRRTSVSGHVVRGRRRARIMVPSGGSDRDIIGVVGDVPFDAHGSPALVVYHANGNPVSRSTLRYVVATELPPERILSAVRDEVAAMDPELVVHNPASMSEVVGRGVSRDRFALVLMGAFSAFFARDDFVELLRYGGSTSNNLPGHVLHISGRPVQGSSSH